MIIKRTKVALLLLFPIFLLIGIVVTRWEQVDNTVEAHDRYAKALIDEWRLCKFVPITTNHVFADHLAGLRIANGKELLTDAQASGLRKALFTFFCAYSAGTYDDYLAFRRPPNVPFLWHSEGKVRLSNYFVKGPTFGSPALVFKWEALYLNRTNKPPIPVNTEEQFKLYLKEYSGDNFYAKYWTAVCLTNASVIVESSGTIPLPLWLYPFRPYKKYRGFSADSSFPNLGYASQLSHSVFEFVNSPTNVLRRDLKLLCANCFFIIECSAPDMPMPVLLRLYYEPESSRWLPWDLVVGNIRKINLRFPIF
jgi:hypothetical protein